MLRAPVVSRWHVEGLLVVLVAVTQARASDLGPDGRLHFAADAITTVDFEDATALASRLQRVVVSGNQYGFHTVAVTASELAPMLVASNDALEGLSVLRLTGSGYLGLELIDATTFATLTAQRVQVSFWGRSEGMEPFLGVTYGNSADLPTTKPWVWARVAAIRTGRETSDGWVEYSTGPIDGAVLGRPIHDILLSARVPTDTDTALRLDAPALHATDAIEIDAVEVRPAAGTPLTAACTAQNVATTCGALGECMYARCVDSAVVWHPVPPKSMQQEIAERLVNWATTFEGDRSAAARVDANWVSTTLALASDSATPKSFWGGLSHEVVLIRDTHTTLGLPAASAETPFLPLRKYTSGPLNVCFGPTANDFAGGAMSYVLWAKGPAAPAALQVGDLVTAIDGLDPKTWVDAVYPLYAGSLPVDPSADWAPSARDLATLVAGRAKTLSLSRCTSGGVCTAQPDFDVATFALAAAEADPDLYCSPRFQPTLGGNLYDSEGGELVLSGPLGSDGGTLAIEFDGFFPTSVSVWKAQLDAALTPHHDGLLMDAREGFGGLNALGNYMLQQLRGTDSPAALALAARGTISDPDAASLFSFDWSTCLTMSSFHLHHERHLPLPHGQREPARCVVEDRVAQHRRLLEQRHGAAAAEGAAEPADVRSVSDVWRARVRRRDSTADAELVVGHHRRVRRSLRCNRHRGRGGASVREWNRRRTRRHRDAEAV